jgi:hypothetical protein
MINKGQNNQIFANFEPGIMKDSHGSFPNILSLDAEDGGYDEVDYNKEDDAQASYPVEKVKIPFQFVLSAPHPATCTQVVPSRLYLFHG